MIWFGLFLSCIQEDQANAAKEIVKAIDSERWDAQGLGALSPDDIVVDVSDPVYSTISW